MQSKSYRILKDGIPSKGEHISEHHIFTTVRVLNGRLVLWNWHERRLVHDAQVLGVSWKRERIQVIKDVASQLQNGALRVTCTHDSWWIHAWKTSIDECKPLNTCWMEWERHFSLPASTKHGYRSLSNRITQEQGVDVLLWHSAKGEVLEASYGNLFSIVDGCIYTLPANGAILDGIGRRVLIHVARRIGLEVYEEPVCMDQGNWWMTSALRSLQRLDVSTDDSCIPMLREEIGRFLLSSTDALRT